MSYFSATLAPGASAKVPIIWATFCTKSNRSPTHRLVTVCLKSQANKCHHFYPEGGVDAWTITD